MDIFVFLADDAGIGGKSREFLLERVNRGMFFRTRALDSTGMAFCVIGKEEIKFAQMRASRFFLADPVIQLVSLGNK